jgi:hydroxymethylbilane synthase
VRGSGVLRLATRGSPLALHQAARVASLLEASAEGSSCELVVVTTTGDRLPDAPIERIGGQGAFVKEVSAAVLDGRADIAVHSAKDLPPATSSGLVLAAVPERADARDALVGSRLEDLRPGATVATGSVRRRAQLAWLRPDLTFCELRGNMHTRVERAERVGAGVLAMAALDRLDLSGRVAEVLDPGVLLPQVGQGAIAVECRARDDESIELLSGIDDYDAHEAVSAERAFLRAIGGGCTLPCGALATCRAPRDGRGREIFLDAMMASRDGHVILRRSSSGEDPVDLGERLARVLVEEAGGRSLEDWR